ncbi:MAG: GntR family transcriptional regulator [Lachnospiraceae bacterium]|nr:GntR family transcriptional regulator [Lachnospiraceae bacterium]
MKSSSFDLAYTTIRSMIADKKILPGQQIVEGNIASQLGISRTPVREALRRLQEEGLIELIPNKGSYLKIVSFAELAYGYEVIDGLLISAYKILTEKSINGTLDMHSFSKLEEYANLIKYHYDNKNLQQWIINDILFHKIAFDMTNNPILIKTFNNLSFLNNQVLYFVTPAVVDRNLSTNDHFLLLKYVKEGNVEEVLKVAHMHIDRVTKQIKQLV